MTSMLAALGVALSVPGGWFSGPPAGRSWHQHLFPPPSEGGFFFRRHHETPQPLPAWYVRRQLHPTPRHHGFILPPGPGHGWGFPNGNPDGYGYADYGVLLPLAADRTPDYNFPRYLSLLPEQCFLQQYYNPYVQRGQRYIPYTGCGGEHPFGGAAPGTSETPVHPDEEARERGPLIPVPSFEGRVEAPPASGPTPTMSP